MPSSTNDEGSGTAEPPKAPMFGSGPETSLKELSWINEPGSETRVKLASTEKPIPDLIVSATEQVGSRETEVSLGIGCIERHLSGSGDERRELQGTVVSEGGNHGEGIGRAHLLSTGILDGDCPLFGQLDEATRRRAEEAAGTDDGTGYRRVRGSGIGEVRVQVRKAHRRGTGRQRGRALKKSSLVERGPAPLVHAGTIYSGEATEADADTVAAPKPEGKGVENEELGKGFVWFAEMTCVKAPWPEGSE